jgi:prepilin signal peptidase PulO-like enzyme (type II secretory pathway)
MKEISLKNIKEMPSDARVEFFLAMVQRAMREFNISWVEITRELIGKDCMVCGSRIRSCENCSQSVSLGTLGKCVHCGTSTERLEIEASHR